MNSLHFALTPLAGSPIRIVNALNRYTGIRARLVTLDTEAYGARVFENDLDWRGDKESVLELAENADILVLHNFFRLDANPFGIDFRPYRKRGKGLVRQLHTAPGTLAKINRCDTHEIVQEPLPQLVVAQFHERHYPKARMVPLLLPIGDEAYTPIARSPEEVRIFYGPTTTASAWKSRWDTKGCPETCGLLKKVARGHPAASFRLCQGRSHSECLARRRECHLSVDEMVTGSFHTSSLESLSQGIPTFAYLDARTQYVLQTLTGAQDLPWMNFRLEEAESALHALVEDGDLREEIGSYSRQWMEKHWREEDLVKPYETAFLDVVQRPGTFEARFDVSQRRVMWFVRDAYDMEWAARRRRCLGSSRLLTRIIPILREQVWLFRDRFRRSIRCLLSRSSGAKRNV